MFGAIVLLALAIDPAYSVLDKAYSSLRDKDYDAAVASFRQAVELAPTRADIRKNLAYTLLKVGQNDAARDAFADAMRLDPADQTSALEYAFLCHETGQTRQARLTFDKLRQSGNGVAQQAFDNIDKPLGEGISRWSKALETEPNNFSAHEELARLAWLRNDLKLSAEQYLAAWRLRTGERRLLISLGRVYQEANLQKEANAALLAASRGGQPRYAEEAKSLLPKRYPYVYEFQQALALDPENVDLRRELAYLHLAMGNSNDARMEFEGLVLRQPNDRGVLTQLAMLKGTPIPPAAADPSAAAAPMMKERPQMAEVRALADKSYQAGFLKDALKYYTQLVETDPNDYKSALRLAWTYNQLHQDREAFHLFNQARMAPDAQVAAEAQRAYDNLKPQFQTARASAWMLPFYSSRWKDAFAYGQFKTEVRVPQIPFLRPYVSMRMIGDARGSINKPGEVYPQYLSESAVIPGAGVATPVYRGLMAWAEAGYALSYLAKKDDRRGRPDYRGGVSFSRGFGQLLGGSNAGAFAENHEDGVFVSRFNNSLLFYTQNKVGYTLRALESFDDLRIQFYVNVNVTADAKRQYWANFVEYGPGIRLRWKSLPRGMTLSVDYPRGRYLITNNNPNPLSFTDLRAGFWYAFSR